MPRKPIELPPTVARAFVKDIRALLRGKERALKRDEIRSARALRGYNPPRAKKLRLSDVHAMLINEFACVRPSGCGINPASR